MQSELLFPLKPWHNQGSCIVECPNGDLLVWWYHGSGERTADDVAVLGARKRKGDRQWSAPFVMVDTPGYPNTNPAMFIDPKKRLWLIWPTILDNNWGSALLQYRIASNMRDDGPPPQRVPISESKDRGVTWSPVVDSDRVDTGAGVEVLALKSGRWLLVNNDLEEGRHRLAVTLSDDEGKTWKWKRYLERDTPADVKASAGSYHYPSVILSKDGTIHVSYSFHQKTTETKLDASGKPAGESIKHAHFNEVWVRQGDGR